MKAGHIHVNVKDLRGALDWVAKVLDWTPRFSNDHMAVLPFGTLTIIVDRSDADSEATLAFASEDCDADYAKALERGAEGLRPPEDQPWGPVRAAYLKGPGRLTVEIEQLQPERLKKS